MKASLFYGKDDGEIFVIRDIDTDEDKMVTCIDITTLYGDKHDVAIDMVKTL